MKKKKMRHVSMDDGSNTLFIWTNILNIGTCKAASQCKRIILNVSTLVCL